MSFTLFGYISGVAYHLTVSDGGEVDGTDNAMEFLATHEGERVLATPTGPEFVLDRKSPESVLAAFNSRTEVVDITGDPPQLYEPEQNGVVY